MQHRFMFGVGYVGYDLQQLCVTVNTPAVLRGASPFAVKTDEPPLTLADRVDAFKRNGMTPIVAEVVFIRGGGSLELPRPVARRSLAR